MNRQERFRYMASRAWALKREAVRKRAGNNCERCKYGPFEQVHHLTYEHLGNEPLEDLLGLCEDCHRYESGLTDVDPAKKRPLWQIKPYPEEEAESSTDNSLDEHWDGPPTEELHRRAFLQPHAASDLWGTITFSCPGCRTEGIRGTAKMFANGKWTCLNAGKDLRKIKAHNKIIAVALGVIDPVMLIDLSRDYSDLL